VFNLAASANFTVAAATAAAATAGNEEPYPYSPRVVETRDSGRQRDKTIHKKIPTKLFTKKLNYGN